MKIFKPLILLLILMMAACTPAQATQGTGGTPADGSGATPGNLDNTQWWLLSFRDGEVETPVIEGSTVTLSFEAGNRAVGNGGCNSYGGTYQVQGDSLKFSDLASTLMACADNRVTDQEGRVMSALQAAERYEISGNQLTIWHSGGNGKLIFTKAE